MDKWPSPIFGDLTGKTRGGGEFSKNKKHFLFSIKLNVHLKGCQVDDF